MRRLPALALLLLASCGTDEDPSVVQVEPALEPGIEQPAEPATTEPDVEPVEAPIAPPRGLNLHIRSRLVFDAMPDAPHQLQATYQGPDRCRWIVERLADEDSDRRIEYRSGERAFVLPQDSNASLEYGGEELARVLRRLDLRRLAMADGLGQLEWDENGLLPLGLAGSTALREDLGDEGVTFTAIDPGGRLEEVLHVRSWTALGDLRRPKQLELHFGSLRIWQEEVENFQLQSWFKERYFWPPDRADEAP